MKNATLLSSLALSFLLISCTPVTLATGVGVATGTAAVQEGGISRAVSDAGIQASINDLWFKHDLSMFAKLDMTVNQGRVLITGVVQDPKHRIEAVRLAWQPKGVVQVINEIKIAEGTGIVGFAKDSWISARIRTALIWDKQVESINYSVDTVQGSVYLMGFAQNQAELNHVISIVRSIENVKQVVSYVKLVGAPEPVPGGLDSTTPTPAPYDDQSQLNPSSSAASSNALTPEPFEASADPIEWGQESVYD